MANPGDSIICGGFSFYNNFDSANLAKVELVKVPETFEKDACETENKSCRSSNSEDATDYEFNLWTKHDCHGTQYQNNNRTWFYFGVKASTPGVYIKFNIINLNKQVKMFSQGMCPVFKVVPGHLHWERIRDKPTYTLDQKGSDFTLSFVYFAPENPKAITYFAFTYPFSYTDLQNYLRRVEARILKRSITSADDVYYHRECAIKSLEGRRMDLITISSFHNISTEREDRLNNMFPEKTEERPFKFWDKKVIFISARVHPGETPSSFVFNGFLNFLINREDNIAINLRRLYVFKLIPMLNPDGVVRGHYRMDTRGINLNRVYLNPSLKDHPTIYAARNLIRYYHHTYQLPKEDEISNMCIGNGENTLTVIDSSCAIANIVRDTTTRLLQQVTLMSLDEKRKDQPEIFQECASPKTDLDDIPQGGGEGLCNKAEESNNSVELKSDKKTYTAIGIGQLPKEDSGLYLYIDLHGHASKKGVFMYGNYFDNAEDTIMCMLLPKLMSINNPNFHFTSCNFTERNMYIIDKRDGMSREGSGRVAVYKLTGLIRSYTLECNYNSGRLVNSIPSRIRDGVNKTVTHMFVPPKYTPAVFEAVGAALGPSILDLTNNNPNSRLPNSQYRSLRGVKSYLKLAYVNNVSSPNGKSLHKDDNNIIPSDSYNLKDIESQISNSSVGLKNSMKSETSFVKKPCIIRRTTSLYTAVKRIKNNKKVRQTVTRRPLKNQCVNDIESSSKIPVIGPKSIVKSFLKTSENRLKSSCFGCINDSSEIRDIQYANKKLIATNKFSKMALSSEETAIVKHGAKRLKIVSMKVNKGKSEVGESSNNVPETIKSPSKTLFLSNKQNVRGTTKAMKKYCHKME
ncbi:cytosolic carboxypeptidase-like protein 5 isoform X1 [Bombus vancouverensis nearcticus]|uniref:tubulin-glutamate carboxypeptidase n=1 Tax=Bombus bifarius TaxID=103933 RepID=A0A6P8MMQ4_9HYME|nr:cytosolic carboxypeptidase-like protein 5 isoform X1 [Bombus vancouverensis nearcticus]XP_033200465.1 cytosolic carboxypeptidase-like protein 5 isoform X1 [Bombus vancouverensis nearcticus]XP_033200466.1 cytosolic carboxypeptidase-like protein 5 isoform X1 [Bombus vancouverensis nearcticus]XP_033303412.1 cytosolic carboxypeptidase-like protein 5 isoform X1 [Bombus bifarius]XP_033303413.1 cytosolic carboxypeptidase-like protein 5 isoform X1 [Bombus bifarius]XP_033303414.1 cytosolic carboxype